MILGVGPGNFWIPVSDGFLDPETSQIQFSLHKRIFKHMTSIFKLMMDWWMNKIFLKFKWAYKVTIEPFHGIKTQAHINSFWKSNFVSSSPLPPKKKQRQNLHLISFTDNIHLHCNSSSIPLHLLSNSSKKLEWVIKHPLSWFWRSFR